MPEEWSFERDDELGVIEEWMRVNSTDMIKEWNIKRDMIDEWMEVALENF